MSSVIKLNNSCRFNNFYDICIYAVVSFGLVYKGLLREAYGRLGRHMGVVRD